MRNFQFKKNLQPTCPQCFARQPCFARQCGLAKRCRRTIYNPQPNYGFTLIEILVAATLIGILSTIGLTGFQAITRSGRDALRKTNLEQIRSALEIYKSENGTYPSASSTCIADLSANYINPYPTDPKSSYRYCYVPGTGNTTYSLCAYLENGVGGSYCTSANCGSGTTCNYQVTNP